MSGLFATIVPAWANWVAATVTALVRQPTPPVTPCAATRPEISVSWVQRDFGRRRDAAAFSTQDLVVSSIGTADLVLTSVAFSGTDFSIVNADAYLRTVPPGQSTTLTLKFAPGTPGRKTDRLVVASNGANVSAPIGVDVEGTLVRLITFDFKHDTSGEGIPDISVTLQQSGQPAQQGKSNHLGRVEIETLVDGPFDLTVADDPRAHSFVSTTQS